MGSFCRSYLNCGLRHNRGVHYFARRADVLFASFLRFAVGDPDEQHPKSGFGYPVQCEVVLGDFFAGHDSARYVASGVRDRHHRLLQLGERRVLKVVSPVLLALLTFDVPAKPLHADWDEAAQGHRNRDE